MKISVAITLPKETIDDAITAIAIGIDNTNELLACVNESESKCLKVFADRLRKEKEALEKVLFVLREETGE